VTDLAELRKAVDGVVDPSLRRNLAELGMVREVVVEDSTARVGVVVPTPV